MSAFLQFALILIVSAFVISFVAIETMMIAALISLAVTFWGFSISITLALVLGFFGSIASIAGKLRS